MISIPKDPVILLSFMNTQLRDYYPTLHECCLSLGIQEETVSSALGDINYYYDEKTNQFI